MNAPIEQLTTCPHCGNDTIHEILYSITTTDKAYSTNNPEDFIFFDISYYLTMCKTCLNISLFYDTEDDENQGELNDAYICYPKQKNLGNEIPESIMQNYREAIKIKNISSTAFAVMIRRGLEFLCKENSAKGQTLKKQLEDLGAKGIIPSTLAEMGNTLRFLGNIGAHATKYKIDRSEVQAMDDFFIAMLEYVYVGPAKLARLKESIKIKQSDKLPPRSRQQKQR